MNKLDELLSYAESQVGYTEKNNDTDLESKVGNTVGNGNHTKYGKMLERLSLPGYCGSAWCGTYQMALDVQTVGVQQALYNLGKEFYNCFATMQYAKREGRWMPAKGAPEPGYRVIFSQSHIALVTRVTAEKIYTNEGNTSNGTAVVRNGGMVCNKWYYRSDPHILGYVIVEYEKDILAGWSKEGEDWKFYLDSDRYVTNDWYLDIDGKWYWFDGSGNMVISTWYMYNGGWYYLGADGAMLKGLKDIEDKWYCLDNAGKMITDPVVLTPDQDGALRYMGITN